MHQSNRQATLAQAGAALSDVAQLTMSTSDTSQRKETSRAHREHLLGIAPAVTVVEASALMAPGRLLEIEATAVVPD